MARVIGNPISWGANALARGAQATSASVGNIGSTEMSKPVVNRLAFADIRRALRAGIDDFAAMRTDVAFLVLVYPAIGVLLAALAYQASFLHLVFPLMTGFALVGPFAAIGLYEMSKRRAETGHAGFADAFRAVRRETVAPVLALGVYLFVILTLWLYAADQIYAALMGAAVPESVSAFVTEVFSTGAGQSLIVIGSLVGFGFALLVLATGLVSFQMLVDRPVGLPAAVTTSLRVIARNPAVVAGWGLIIAITLALGAAPALIGLILVFPVLGHASWHFYRAAVSYE